MLSACRHNADRQTLGLVSLVVACVFGIVPIFWGTHPDEADNLALGALIAEGQVLYRDLFTHHAPLPYYWVATLTPLFGYSIFALRLSVWLYQIASFYAAMRITGYYAAIGIAALVWGTIHHVYLGHYVIYPSICGPALLVIGCTIIALLDRERQPTWRHSTVIAVYSLLSLFSDPRSLIAIGVVLAMLATINWRHSLLAAGISGLTGFLYVLYLLLTGSLASFWHDLVLFNATIYAAYNDAPMARLTNVLYFIRTGLRITSHAWFTFDLSHPIALYMADRSFDTWLFTGFFYRFSILWFTLLMLIRQRWRIGLFVYLYAIALMLIDEWGMRGQPFILFGLFCGASTIVTAFSSIWYTDAWQNGTRGVIRWVHRSVAVVMISMLIWLNVYVIVATLQKPEELTYRFHFSYVRNLAAHLAQWKCGAPSVRLAHYPQGSYTYWFARMPPITRYILMWPWIAEVGMEEDLAWLLRPDALAVLKIEDMNVWDRYATREYLASLYELLEQQYVQVAAGEYISPALAAQCQNAGVATPSPR